MHWTSRLFVLATLGTLLMAMNAMAISPLAAMSAGVTTPTGTKTRPLQFTSGGHIVGFTSKDVYVATGSHALRVEFVGAQGVEPVAAGAAASDGKAAPLTRVNYPGLWDGVTLAYDAPAGLLRSTYTVAPGADPGQIRLRYNAPVAVEPAGELRITFATGAMRESAPVAWQERDGRRVPVTVAFRTESEKEVVFALGPYDKTRPLTIDPTLTWNTFLGGADYDSGSGIAVDASGNIYITGIWGDLSFTSTGADAFVAKLDANGILIWNTIFGAHFGFDAGAGIALDASGSVYVIGTGDATWGAPIRQWTGYRDAFVAKLDANGALLWNTFLGGEGFTSGYGYGIAVEASGNVYVTGSSDGTWGTPIRPWAGGSTDAFVAKLDTKGTLIWNTFLGQAGFNAGYGIAVDARGDVYVTGSSEGTWGAPIRPWAGGSSDAFVAKLDTNGSLIWNTFLGQAGFDEGYGLAVDARGDVYVTGYSSGTWGFDAFVAKLDTNGALLWNTFLGGGGWDSGNSIAVEANGNVYVTGYSSGMWGAPIRPWAGGSSDALVAMLDTNGALLWNTFLGGTNDDYDYSYGIALDASGNIYVSGGSSEWWGAPIRQLSGSSDAFVAKLGNSSFPPSVSVKNDFDGDGRSDIGVYYTHDAGRLPPGGDWYGFNGGNGYWQTQFGYPGALLVTGDFDGDGKSDIGYYDPGPGTWQISRSTDGLLQTQFGFAGTIPVVGDFDGDGRDDIGAYHPDSGNWYVMKSQEGFWQAQFGYGGTIPVVGDFDGDGKSDIGVYHPASGTWYLSKSKEGFLQTQFGFEGTIPVVGDYDGDGKSDIGVCYPAGGDWYVMKSAEGFWQTQFGYAGTEPVVGDFDGDGRSDIAVYYAPGGDWYFLKSSEGFWQTQFGFEGTIPLGGAIR